MERGSAQYRPLTRGAWGRLMVQRLRSGPFRTARLNVAGWSALIATCVGAGLLARYAVSRVGGPSWFAWVAGLVPLATVLVLDRRRAQQLRAAQMRAEQVRVRPAVAQDLASLSAIEKSGDAAFRDAGMDLVADAEATPADGFRPALQAGRLLVAVDDTDQPMGFVRVEIVDGCPHVEQVSVLPSHAGRHTGALLLHEAAIRAQAAGHSRMTLRTFTEVPWNGPYYARLGWQVLPEQQWGPDLRALADHEAELGLLRWPRQAMVLHL